MERVLSRGGTRGGWQTQRFVGLSLFIDDCIFLCSKNNNYMTAMTCPASLQSASLVSQHCLKTIAARDSCNAQTHKRHHCSSESPKSGKEIDSGTPQKRKLRKKSPAVWDHVLFGLGGSGTGRNAQSPSEQQRNISSNRACFLKEWVIIVGQLKPFK